MVRSYLTVFALLCLAAAVGCGDDGGGTGGTGGTAGTGGTGGTGGMAGVPDPVTKTVSLGCSNSVTTDISILDWELTVAPSDPIVGGGSFDADLSGVAFFSEDFLDVSQSVIVGGVRSAGLTDLAATVTVRSGATGDPVLLGPTDIPYTCALPDTNGDPVSCDPANAVGDFPNDENTDCQPQGIFNRCRRFVNVPVSEDCASGGECEQLDPSGCTGDECVKAGQCATNGFCVTGPLPLDLAMGTGSYTADASGVVRFGWDDSASVKSDGTYDLPMPLFLDPTPPNGLRVNPPLAVAVQCTMAVDSNGPDGVGVPDQASPTPDDLLIEFAIQ
jgi:hypothetical protein